MDNLAHEIYNFPIKVFVIASQFFVIKNFKFSQPKGCCGLKFSLASNLPHILGYSKVSYSPNGIGRRMNVN